MVIWSHYLNTGMFNVMFHMINKRALLVEVSCTLISLNFYLFQNNFVLGAPNGFYLPYRDFTWRPCMRTINLSIFRCPYKTPFHLTHSSQPNNLAF